MSPSSTIATRHRNAGAERGHSPEFWRRYAELGAIGALFAERDGGLGGAGFDIAVVFEALGRGLVVEPFLDALMVGSAIAQAGTPAQRESLDGLIAGEQVAALACAEPDAGYELSRLDPRRARRRGLAAARDRPWSTPAGTPTCTWCRRARPAPETRKTASACSWSRPARRA